MATANVDFPNTSLGKMCTCKKRRQQQAPLMGTPPPKRKDSVSSLDECMLETPSGNYRIQKSSYPKLQKSESSPEKNQTNRIKTRSSEHWIGKETEEIKRRRRNWEFAEELLYRAPDNERGPGIEVEKIERNLHPGIASTHHENIAALVVCAGLVLAGMQHGTFEVGGAGDHGTDGLRILTGCYHKPASAEFRRHGSSLLLQHQTTTTQQRVVRVARRDFPVSSRGVERGRRDLLIESEIQLESRRVILQVVHELLPVRVRGVIRGKRQMRKLAELFGDVQVQTVVGLVLPQRRNAVGFLQNQARDSLQLQARSGGQARRPGTHHDGPVPERRRRRRRKSSCSRLRLAAAAESEIVSGFAHVLLLGAECLVCVRGIRRHFCCCCCCLSFRTSFLSLSADQSLLASSTTSSSYSSCNVGCEEFSSLSTPFAMGINDKRKCSTLDT